MNLSEQKSPAGWNWGAKDVDWREFVLPIYVCRSLDDGKTWQEPVFLNKPRCGCIHSMIETGSGRIVLVGQEAIGLSPDCSCRFFSSNCVSAPPVVP